MASYNLSGFNTGDWSKYLNGGYNGAESGGITGYGTGVPVGGGFPQDFPGAANLQIAPDQPTPTPPPAQTSFTNTSTVGKPVNVDPSGNWWDPTSGRKLTNTAPAGVTGNDAAYTPPAASGTFSDPASAAWEQLLNERIKQLQQPYQNPAFDQTLNQLNAYLARLNGPAYTNDQMGLLQTQALDPLERQRQAMHQQVLQRAASRGLDPKSGIVEKELQDADQQFNALRTKTQAGFASGAIGLGNQNAGMAAQIAPLISKLYQDQFNSEEQRRNQATSLAGVVPQEAWQRLLQANGTVNQTNPLSALDLLKAFQSQGYNQNADFSGGLTQLIELLLGS